VTLQIFDTLEQGTPEWDDLRRGIVTASTVHQLVTAKTLKVASNIESRALAATLVAERITGWTDERYVSFDMERGHEIEPEARRIYSENYAPVTVVAFMVREYKGFRIGYSPDGVVSDDGLIETKSRRPKEHLATVLRGEVPAENMAQLQTGLLVSGRKWIDYLSYCGGMALWRKRVYPDPAWRTAILAAVAELEDAAIAMTAAYLEATKGLPMTERPPVYEEMRF